MGGWGHGSVGGAAFAHDYCLPALRAGRRSAQAVETALAGIEEAARGEANLMPRIVEAVEKQATLGEIADRLRAVYGVYHEAFAF